MNCPCEANEIEASLIRSMFPSSQGKEYCRTNAKSAHSRLFSLPVNPRSPTLPKPTHDIMHTPIENLHPLPSLLRRRLPTLNRKLLVKGIGVEPERDVLSSIAVMKIDVENDGAGYGVGEVGWRRRRVRREGKGGNETRRGTRTRGRRRKRERGRLSACLGEDDNCEEKRGRV